MSKKRKNKQNTWQIILKIIIIICIIIGGYITSNVENENNNTKNENTSVVFDLSSIPEYTSNPYVEINNKTLNFSKVETEKTFSKSFVNLLKG